MKCPHCEYEQGYHYDENDAYVNHNGSDGDFWVLPVKVEREVDRDWHDDGNRQTALYACPRCKKSFIADNQ